MPALSISEFSQVFAEAYSRDLPAAQVANVIDSSVAIGAGTTASSTFNANTRVIRLMADVSCSVKFGVGPVATVNNMRLAAFVPEYFTVPAGKGFAVAVIAN